jgi:1,4-dihydroxy-2-naphthoyl-CoA synthase
MEYREGLKFLEQKLFVLLQTEDAREGLAAFLQKRDPKWSGR